jgi:ankyrin repeat protein
MLNIYINGIDLNEQNEFGKTLLIKAAINGDLKNAKLLLRFQGRVDVSIKDNEERTALHYALINLSSSVCNSTKQRYMEIVRLIKKAQKFVI